MVGQGMKFVTGNLVAMLAAIGTALSSHYLSVTINFHGIPDLLATS